MPSSVYAVPHQTARSIRLCVPIAAFIFMLCVLLSQLSVSADETDTDPDVGVRFQPPEATALTNATVIVSAGREMKAATVIVRDGKILAIGKDVDVPAGAEIIDCQGKFLYPAFIDCMVECESRPFEPTAGYWNRNVTPERRMDREVTVDKAKMQSLRKAGVSMIVAAPNSGIIKGQSCVLSTADADISETLVRPQAFQHVRLYPNRGSGERYPNSPMGAMSLARQAFSDADWYQRAQQASAADTTLPRIEHNSALEALQAVLRGGQSLIVDGTNELYAVRGDRLAREFSLKLVVRGSGREYRNLDQIGATKRTFIIPVNFPDAPKLNTEAEVANATLQSLMDWRLAPENPAKLAEAGVEFVLTSDGLKNPSDLLSGVRKAIEHGLSKDVALAALTSLPAELLDIEDSAGTLQAGKFANILVTSGRLFDKESKIEETWVQGVRHAWETQQEIDLRGDWELNSETLPTGLVLNVTGKPEKLSAKLGTAGAFEKAISKDTAPGKDENDSDGDDDDGEDDDNDDNDKMKMKMKMTKTMIPTTVQKQIMRSRYSPLRSRNWLSTVIKSTAFSTQLESSPSRLAARGLMQSCLVKASRHRSTAR